MQNNSNDNIQNWKQRLDDFEDIAGNNLDRNDAWEKLQQKKIATKAPNKKIWYWLAAACVAGLSVFIVDNIYEQPVKTTAPGIAKTTNSVPVKENNITIIKNAPVVLENNKEKRQIIKDDHPPVTGVIIERNDISEEPLLVKQQPEQMIALADTIARPSLPVIAKNKKLKVVHINELNQNNNGIAQQEGKPYFPITYQTKQVYTNAADNSTKTGKDNLIRIKLFP